MNKYGPLLFLLLAVVLLISFIGKVRAYTSDMEEVVNHVDMGFNETRIVEDYKEAKSVKPGDVINKTVKVENTGNGDCYVRIKAVFSHSLTGDYCAVDWNTNDFTYNPEDGYWYYNRILPTDGITPALMTTITVGTDIPTGIEDLPEIKVIVYAESVQSKLFADASEAWAFFNAER